MSADDLTFEAGYEELEKVVARLQEGGLSLEESLSLFERGILLARRCNEQLEQAELRVRQLLANGQLEDITLGAEEEAE
ncbi:MAG: exodeoxyribonuclease VII small subunit [Anaerolineae bacterium]|nr:exodeoxyribonuclease VII small subunit [Anaerolineae bacterium]